MLKLMCAAMLAGFSCTAMAQAAPPAGDGPGGPPRGWELGVGLIVSSKVYAGEGSRLQPIPLLTYQGERFSLRGLTAAWKLYGNDSVELSAIGKLRLGGFKVKDLGQAELARNGIDYRLLDDRDNGFDLGLQAKWQGGWGELEAEMLADVSGASKGQELSLQYGYGLDVGGGMLTPGVGITWQSGKMANYYYGTLRGRWLAASSTTGRARWRHRT